jgi:hypothetical protein
VHLLLSEQVRNLTQVKCGAGKTIQAGDNKAILFPDIFDAGLQPEAVAESASFLLLENLLTVFQLIPLHRKILTHRADPRIADKCLCFYPL